MNSKIKLILIVRDPVARIVSHFTHLLDDKNIKYDPTKYESLTKYFEDLVFYNNGSLKIKGENFTTEQFETTLVIDSLYVLHLRNWLQYFPMKQLLVLNGEEFIKNPYNEIKQVEEFLELTPFITKEHFVYDSTKKFHCLNINLEKNNAIKCLQKKKGRTHPFIEPNVLEKLKVIFKPYDNDFFDSISKEPFWS